MSSARYFTLSVAGLLTWGTLAFGAVYPWAYWPLTIGAAAVGVWGLIAGRDRPLMPISTSVMFALVAVLAAMLIQTIPVKREYLKAWSPTAVSVIEQYNLPYAAGTEARHSLSLNPQATVTAIVMFSALFLFLVGAVRMLSVTGASSVASALVVLGVIIALLGIIQKPVFTGKIYGFWEPYGRGNVFGPFVNRNHFAGWMAMMLSLAMGYACGCLADAIRNVRPGSRNRLMWLASPQASQIVLVGLAIFIMALSMVLTFSRGAIICLALSLTVTIVTVARKQRGIGRLIMSVYCVILVAITAVAGGVDLIAAQFAAADWSELNGRLDAWKDSWNIAKRFMPLGSGMNTYSITTLFYQEHDTAVHYAQAHNDYLQLLAEGGLLVGVPLAAAILLLVRAIWRTFAESEVGTKTYWIRLGAATGLSAIALQESVDFSLQMPANALLFTLLVAITLHRPNASFDARETALARMKNRESLSVRDRATSLQSVP